MATEKHAAKAEKSPKSSDMEKVIDLLESYAYYNEGTRENSQGQFIGYYLSNNRFRMLVGPTWTTHYYIQLHKGEVSLEDLDSIRTREAEKIEEYLKAHTTL